VSKAYTHTLALVGSIKKSRAELQIFLLALSVLNIGNMAGCHKLTFVEL
jgi:hypothetical protein